MEIISYYTLSIKDFFDNFATGNNIDNKIIATGNFIFDFNFPWYEDKTVAGVEVESLRDFKRIFVEKYFTQEMAYETIALWKMKLQEVLYRKIPYYTDLYNTFKIDYNPLINYEKSGNNENKRSITNEDNGTLAGKNTFAETSRNEVNGTITTSNTNNSTSETNSSDKRTNTTTNNLTAATNGTNNQTTNNQSVHSDYPQASFNPNADFASNMDRGETINQSTDNTTTTNTGTVKDDGSSSINSKTTSNDTSNGSNNNQSTTTGNNNSTTDTSQTHSNNSNSNENSNGNFKEQGFMGSKVDEIVKYRKAIQNINEQLVNEFTDLFMGIEEPLENRSYISTIYPYGY